MVYLDLNSFYLIYTYFWFLQNVGNLVKGTNFRSTVV